MSVVLIKDYLKPFLSVRFNKSQVVDDLQWVVISVRSVDTSSYSDSTLSDGVNDFECKIVRHPNEVGQSFIKRVNCFLDSFGAMYVRGKIQQQINTKRVLGLEADRSKIYYKS